MASRNLPPFEPATEGDYAMAKSSWAFAVNLYKSVGESPGTDDLVFSPASISLALAMTYGGARAETAEQMKRVVRFEGEQKDAVRGWGRLASVLGTPSRELKLHVANRLFGEKTYAFQPAFVADTGKIFASPIETLDFKQDSASATARINDWVASQTERRIIDLVKPLNGMTRLLLVNAVYFLADWDTPFPERATLPKPFTLANGEKKSVSMMQQTSRFDYAKVDGAQIVSLPYKGGTAAMWIILPEARDGLRALERTLDANRLEQWRGALSKRKVEVSLPRFEVNPKEPMGMKATLSAMGMPLAFDRDKADFRGIGDPPDPRERLFIDDVLHKAFIKVDEKGTEAAAATAVVMMAAGGAPPAPETPVVFRADHPFAYVLFDVPTGLVLFMGRVHAP